MWVATQDLPRSAAHPFYARLNQILDQAHFDSYVEVLCQRFYADEIAWRATDSFALREFLGLELPEAPPDHSTIRGPAA